MSTLATKDPNEVVDYILDWEPRLRGDIIIDAQFELVNDSGLVIDYTEYTETLAIVWLSGGTSGSHARIKCQITTAGSNGRNRIMEQTFGISIMNK